MRERKSALVIVFVCLELGHVLVFNLLPRRAPPQELNVAIRLQRSLAFYVQPPSDSI
jgi:hypothetical protein